jgi:hypothetical protein
MAQELLTYAGLAQRLNITIGAAKGLAKGLHLTRYAAPDGKTLLLVDLSRLRAGDLAADDVEDEPVPIAPRRARPEVVDDGEEIDFEPRRRRRPGPRRAARAQIVASLHERIEDIQRQLYRVEDASDGQTLSGPDSHALAELFRIAADARQTAEQAREEVAAQRSRRWWKRA